MFDSLSLPLSTLRERLLFLENCFLYITPEGPFGDIVADALALLLVLLWLGLVAWLLFWIHSVKFIASATLPFTRHDMAFGFVVGFACSGDIAGIREVVLQFALTICLLTLCRRFGVIMFDDSGHTSLGNVFRAGITLFYGLEMFLIGFIGGFSVGTTFMVLAAVLVAVVALVVFAVNARRCARSVGEAARWLRSWFTRFPKRLKHVFRALLRWPLWVFVVCKRRKPVFRAFLRWLFRTVVVVAAFLAGLVLLPECFVPALVTLFFFWLFFRAAKRACFLWSRVLGGVTSKGIRVWSAILLLPVSLMAAVLFVWAFYLAATPFRPLDYCPAPKEKIADWLKDDKGELPSRSYFEVGDSSCLPNDEAGWSNLLARVGDPPPPELRYSWIGSRPDPFMESETKTRITSLVDQRHSNLVSRTALSDDDRKMFDEWLVFHHKRTEELSNCSGSTSFISGYQCLVSQFAIQSLIYFLPNIWFSRNSLMFDVDEGTEESFAAALRQCDADTSVLLEKEEDIVGALVVNLLVGEHCNHVLRFSERSELSPRVYREIRDEIQTKERPSVLRYMAICLVRNARSVPGECFQKGGRALFGAWPGFSWFKMRLVEAVVFAMGYDDRKAADASMRENQEWAAVRFSTMLDPEYHEPNPLDERGTPIRWLLAWWVRGGIVRGILSHAILPFDRHFVRSLFADAYPAVEDAALQLAEFRVEKGRDAESIEEASEAIGAEVPDAKSAFVELRYERIAAPEGSLPGTSAYMLALVPKATAPEWFRDSHYYDVRLVVRNPAFPGTRPYRLYAANQFMNHTGKTPFSGPLAAVEGTTDAENARFVIPAALFGSDAKAIEQAETDMALSDADPYWTLE